jgi:hypothetical protein
MRPFEDPELAKLIFNSSTSSTSIAAVIIIFLLTRYVEFDTKAERRPYFWSLIIVNFILISNTLSILSVGQYSGITSIPLYPSNPLGIAVISYGIVIFTITMH